MRGRHRRSEGGRGRAERLRKLPYPITPVAVPLRDGLCPRDIEDPNADDNGDGVLAGDELKGLAIWHDANGDGVCDPGEVKPLSEYGIVAVSCRFERDPSHPDRIAFSPRGVTFRSGKTRPTFDLILKQRDGK